MVMLGIINTHLYCLTVQASFYSDVVECWLRMLRGPGFYPRPGQKVISSFHLLQNASSISSRFTFHMLLNPWTCLTCALSKVKIGLHVPDQFLCHW